jgi:hypothetical protein
MVQPLNSIAETEASRCIFDKFDVNDGARIGSPAPPKIQGAYFNAATCGRAPTLADSLGDKTMRQPMR